MGDKGLDILINNIGVANTGQTLEEATLDDFREQFEINTLGPQIVTKAFLPLLRKGSKKIIMNMYIPCPLTLSSHPPQNPPSSSVRPRLMGSSSLVGSITYNDGRFPFKAPAYGSSKAALNFLSVDYAKHLAPEGFVVVPLSPGVNLLAHLSKSKWMLMVVYQDSIVPWRRSDG